MRNKMLFVVIAVVAAMAATAQLRHPGGSENIRERLERMRAERLARRAAQQNGTQQNAAQPTAAQPQNGAQPTAAQPAVSRPSTPVDPDDPGAVTMSGETSVMNMDGAALELVLKIYGELINKTIIVDPAVQGTLNNTIKFKSAPGQKLTNEERIFAYETILEMNQIHLEPYGDSFIRALPRKDARREGIPLIMDPETQLGESGKVVSMMINFKNIAAEEVQKVFDSGFKSASGSIIIFERTNSLLITDTEQNINRMLEIAKMVDVATPVTENVFVRQIKNASASEIKTAIEQIIQESQKELEKSGKQLPAQTAQQQPATRIPTLLRRPGQQQNQPISNESLVMSVSDADRGMIRGKVVIVGDERSNKLIFVTSKDNMDFFDKVIEALDIETTPDTIVKVYRLKYAECEDVSDMINDLIGNAPSSKGTSKGNQNQNARQGTSGNLTRNTPATGQRKSANQRTGEAKTGELSKENTTVLADKRINGIVVMTNKELVPVLEQIIESMDIKLAQVLVETCIIEVSLGDDLKTGIDWVQTGRYRNDVEVPRLGRNGLQMYRYVDAYGNVTEHEDVGNSFIEKISGGEGEEDTTKTWTRTGAGLTYTVEQLAKGALVTGNPGYGQMFGGGGGDGSALLQAMMDVGTNAASSAMWGGANPIGGGVNYLLKSDKLNIAAIIQASKTDTRTKYIASPIVMTVDNKEATIDATENRQFLTGWSAQSGSYGNSGQPTPNYSAKDIGIKIKITPKINPNGTVMLNVEEEYSQYHKDGQTMLIPENGMYVKGNVDLAVERKMSADILLDNMQTVVLGGLTETATSESESGIPILKDIPWIGKWLFGKVSQSEARKELLVFLTPYVLNDAQSAQVEAARRKKSLSDPRPWDDHGWSASNLADPVSKKEQMRRIKDEAAKQDEERRTRIAIEEWKLERAKRLKEMTKAERDLWLEKHKEELDEEKQEEFKKKMQDKDSQEELKKLAASIREQKLAEAAVELKKAEEDTKAENERARLDREKAEAAAKEGAAKEPAKKPEEKLEVVSEVNVTETTKDKPAAASVAPAPAPKPVPEASVAPAPSPEPSPSVPAPATTSLLQDSSLK